MDQQVAARIQVSGDVALRDRDPRAPERVGLVARGVAVAARDAPAPLPQQDRDAGKADAADAHGMRAQPRFLVQEKPDPFVCRPVFHPLRRRF